MVEVVAHRAGNTPDDATRALGEVDMIELDVHVLHGRVEVRHAKVLRPTSRLWEKWYLLPKGAAGVPIEEVLAVLPDELPLMIDLKCFTTWAARRIERSLPAATPVVASTRNWWVLRAFRHRTNVRMLRSCGTKWQLWWALNVTRFGPQQGMCVHEHRLTPNVLARIRQRTPLLFSWGATSTERCDQLEAAGITGVILDDYALAGRVPPVPHSG